LSQQAQATGAAAPVHTAVPDCGKQGQHVDWRASSSPACLPSTVCSLSCCWLQLC
jgi:hypothetical protein